MRLFEFSDAQSQIDLWKLVSDSVSKTISDQAQEQERLAQQAQQKQKKMQKTSQLRKTSPKPTKPKVVAQPPSKSIKTSQQQTARDSERKNTAKSVLQTTSHPKSRVASTQAQNTLQTRSQLALHDPNSVANTERKLYPFANDDVVKRLTS